VAALSVDFRHVERQSVGGLAAKRNHNLPFLAFAFLAGKRFGVRSSLRSGTHRISLSLGY
jgi:hypothetical protein